MDLVTDELKLAIDNNAPLLSLRGASLSIGKRKILDQINLDVAAGEVVTIIGPNGAGKTSLLKVALGLVRPNAGTVKATRGMRIGYMPQRVAIDDTLPLTVARFLALAARRQRRDLARAVAETGIENLLEYPVQAISGGEMQRVLLARALARRPHLLVLDEPAQGLDIAAEGEFYDLIDRQRQNQGLGVLMVGHDLHMVMAASDRIVCLNGHICCTGSPEDVRTDPEFLALFPGQAGQSFAVYRHRHDHRHDVAGDVVDP